jgi:hypothetical protein
MQNLEVLLDCGRFTLAFDQLVVGHAEPRAGVHVIHVFVVQEGPRLANQRIDHMAKVDGFFAVAEQPRHPLKTFVPVPQLEVILVNLHLHLQADILAAHRVSVAFDPQDAVRIHGQRHRRERTQTLRRQRVEGGNFFTKRSRPPCITPLDHLLEEGHEFLHIGEVPSATQTQRLVNGRFQVTMGRFDVTVLVRLPHVDAMALHTVMRQQGSILRRELLVARQIVDGGRQAVATDTAGNATRSVQRILKPGRQGFVRLRMAEVNVFPIRVGEHGVEQHVSKRPSSNRHAK